jgi:hypothetical protein
VATGLVTLHQVAAIHRARACTGGYRALYTVVQDTGRSATAGDVLVLRIFGPGQSRERL